MSKPLSQQIGDAIAAMDATSTPSPVQLAEMLDAFETLLPHLKRFAERVEEGNRVVPGKAIPLHGCSAAGARLYRDLVQPSPRDTQPAMVGVAALFAPSRPASRRRR